MNFEQSNLENRPELDEMQTAHPVQMEDFSTVGEMPGEMKSMNPAVAVYGIQRVSEIPQVREKIDECKEEFKETVAEAGEKLGEFCEHVKESLADFCKGAYENVKDFFTPEVAEADTKEMARWGEMFTETREFGIEECSEAARDIFNEGVLNEWPNLTPEQRRDIACSYAAEVAEAFELTNYKGVYIESLEPGTLGSNNGDGTIHLSDTLIGQFVSPLEIMNTITHELRHQYQSEAIRGEHNIPESVRNEWTVAQQIYNYDQPSCYDPWGYTYNPLEIDARFAGESVVRNVTNSIINS